MYIFFCKVSAHSLAHLLIGFFVFWVLSFVSALQILEISALSEVCVEKIFSYSLGALFTLLIVSFAENNLFSLNPFCLLILLFLALWGSY